MSMTDKEFPVRSPNGEHPPRTERADRRDLAEAIERGGGLDVSALLARAGAAVTTETAAVERPGEWDLESLTTAITRVANRFTAETIGPETDFFDGGGTSIAAVQFVAALAAELDVHLDLDDVFADARPRRLAQRRLGAATQASESERPVLVADSVDDEFAQLMSDVAGADRLPSVEPPDRVVPRRVLLTGATGFLGSHLLLDLLRGSDAHVVCLVRARDDAAGLDRLAEALTRYQLPWSAEVRRRVTVLTGDLREPDLGLSGERWAGLAEEVDAIVNVGAAVDFLRGYRSLRRGNVLGPLTLARLAATGRPKPLHHVSSIAVFNELGRTSMGEDDPVANIGKLVIGYDRTKWAAEAVMRRAREHGLVVTVLRPGGIGGHRETGAHNPRDLNSGIIAALSRFGTVPALRNLHVAPVDWVSKVAAAIVCAPTAWGHNYHLTGTPTALEQMLGESSAIGMDMRVQHWATWCDEVVERIRTEPVPELESLAQVLQSPIARHPLETMASVPAATDERTRAFLRAHNLPEPVRYGAQAQRKTLEMLASTGLARLPQPQDPPYLWFSETLVGTIGPAQAAADTSCTLNLRLSIASTHQLAAGRTVDVSGELRCALLHDEPLTVTGVASVRPHDGIPIRHGLKHPLMHYRLTLREADGGTWWLSGYKHAEARRAVIRQARTLTIELGREGEPAGFAGEVAVPLETYLRDQIDGIQVDPRLSERQRRTAKLLWLSWFGSQLGKGLLEPALRVGTELLDLRRNAKEFR
ncbi:MULTISPECIES: thioester reductase domain-containing protein [Nocardia]|uniref:thioester reductase domain-containing protein n=1 Tax=Nocardia TaxID=1817 RepID=UPI001F10D01A|nr:MULTISPECIES: thioester reductase domain-containing protein [Nocardia]